MCKKLIITNFRIILFALFLIKGLQGFGQNADSAATYKLHVGVMYAPEYSHRMLKGNGETKEITTYRDTIEIAKYGYSAGFAFTYKLLDNIEIESGLLIHNKGYKTKNNALGNSFSQTVLPVYSITTEHFYYLEIPAKIKYTVLNKKLKVFVTGGINLNFLLLQKSEMVLEFSEKQSEKTYYTNTKKFKRMNVAAIAGVGIQQRLDKNAFISIAPTFSASVHSIVDAPVNAYFYSIGLNASLLFGY
jgi:hypothetical protein